MFRISFSLIFMLVSGAAFAETPSASIQKTTQEFYSWVLTAKSSPIPSEKEVKQSLPMLSKSLVTLFNQARTLEAACFKNTPKDEKPAYFEGALLMGNYEGGDEVIIGKPSITGTKASVKSRLFMVDTRFAKATPYRAFSWVDQLKLMKNGSHWEITDMVREDGMSLTKILNQFLKENQSCLQAQ